MKGGAQTLPIYQHQRHVLPLSTMHPVASTCIHSIMNIAVVHPCADGAWYVDIDDEHCFDNFKHLVANELGYFTMRIALQVLYFGCRQGAVVEVLIEG